MQNNGTGNGIGGQDGGTHALIPNGDDVGNSKGAMNDVPGIFQDNSADASSLTAEDLDPRPLANGMDSDLPIRRFKKLQKD